LVGKIVESSPAAICQEIRDYDELLQIDGQPIDGMLLRDIKRMVGGADNSVVALTFSRCTADSEYAYTVQLVRDSQFGERKIYDSSRVLSSNAAVLREIEQELSLASLGCLEGWCRATEIASAQNELALTYQASWGQEKSFSPANPSSAKSLLQPITADEFLDLEKMLPGQANIPSELSLLVYSERLCHKQATLELELEEARTREAGMMESIRVLEDAVQSAHTHIKMMNKGNWGSALQGTASSTPSVENLEMDQLTHALHKANTRALSLEANCEETARHLDQVIAEKHALLERMEEIEKLTGDSEARELLAEVSDMRAQVEAIDIDKMSQHERLLEAKHHLAGARQDCQR